MEKYQYIKQISNSRKIVGSLLLIVSIIILFPINIAWGITLFVMAFFIFFIGLYLVSTEGIEIRFATNEFRIIFSIFGINLGFWEKYPDITYISIIKAKVKQFVGNKYQPLAASTTLRGERIFINLFSETNKITTLYRTNNKTEAIQIAEQIAAFYKVEIKNKI